MTIARPDRRLAQVIEVIGRNKAPVEEVGRTIKELDVQKRRLKLPAPVPFEPPSPKEKAAAKQLARALERVEWILGLDLLEPDTTPVLLEDRRRTRRVPRRRREPNREPSDLEMALDRMLGGKARDDFNQWQKELLVWRERVQAFATYPLGPPKPSATRFVEKHLAAAAAASLLDRIGLRVTVTRHKSTFCRLAAVLYGNKRADLFHQCRAVLKKRN